MISLRGLNDQLRPYAEYTLQLAQAYGLHPTITSVFRSWQEQQDLYDKYLRGESNYPAAAPGFSAHNYGLAWDSWVPDSEMPLWVAIRRYVGWTVPSNDLIHAELPHWQDVIQ